MMIKFLNYLHTRLNQTAIYSRFQMPAPLLSMVTNISLMKKV